VVPRDGDGLSALGVYVHVPWCATRCAYCDFNTYTAGDRSRFAGHAALELARAGAALGGRRAATVFFGGGTPTLLPVADLAAVLRAVEREVGLEPGAEVTVEANPETVTPASLAALREAGFTRVSIGMQSAAPHVLAALGRTHDGDRAVRAARDARAAGFAHVSLDLIFGAAQERPEDWAATLRAAVGAGPDHVSAYGLTVERGTRLHADVRRGRVPAPAEDALAERYAVADAVLGEAGLRWYEVASWARDDAARCRHNEGYWRGADWWGVGPGAHSHVAGRRWWNVRRPEAWAARLEAGRSPAAGEERLDAEQRRLERVLLETRTAAGLPAEALTPAGRAAAARLRGDGLLAAEDPVVLTLRGRLLADLVARELAV
jgi:putative oxygen-independent coproporphyrinogen III oxidase